MCLPLLMAAWLCTRVGVFVCTLVCVFVCVCITFGHDSLLCWLVAASLHHQSKRSLNLCSCFWLKTAIAFSIISQRLLRISTQRRNPLYGVVCFSQRTRLARGREAERWLVQSTTDWRMHSSGGWYKHLRRLLSLPKCPWTRCRHFLKCCCTLGDPALWRRNLLKTQKLAFYAK